MTAASGESVREKRGNNFKANKVARHHRRRHLILDETKAQSIISNPTRLIEAKRVKSGVISEWGQTFLQILLCSR